MIRSYQDIIISHFRHNEQMLFLAGPRQVGKTTLVQSLEPFFEGFTYLNFDIEAHRRIIIEGDDAVLDHMQFHHAREGNPLVIFDEIHKYKHWKIFLKGFYDQFKGKMHILVTGSAKLNIFQRGGDSLMGRYLLYRMHPLSIAELQGRAMSDMLYHQPQQLDTKQVQALMAFGGFPDPFIKNNNRFALQWKRLRRQQLFYEDIRSLKQVQDLSHMEMLATLLRDQAGQQLNYSSLAKALRVSVDTVSRWMSILEEFYYCFRIKPWHKNIKRSLVKEPKVYLWDWSEIDDDGARIENLVAAHLHKSIHYWTDHGLGEFGLYYLRDKEQREVDFVVVRDGQPWFLVEVKKSENTRMSKNLTYYQQQTGAAHAFQVVWQKSYVDVDCFSYTEPVIVPLITFLSQLV